jgi:hypothetical protein
VSRVAPNPSAFAVGSQSKVVQKNGYPGRRLGRATALVPDELPDNSRLQLTTFANIHGISHRLTAQKDPLGDSPLHG